jgi:hypothetical protein
VEVIMVMMMRKVKMIRKQSKAREGRARQGRSSPLKLSGQGSGISGIVIMSYRIDDQRNNLPHPRQKQINFPSMIDP